MASLNERLKQLEQNYRNDPEIMDAVNSGRTVELQRGKSKIKVENGRVSISTGGIWKPLLAAGLTAAGGAYLGGGLAGVGLAGPAATAGTTGTTAALPATLPLSSITGSAGGTAAGASAALPATLPLSSITGAAGGTVPSTGGFLGTLKTGKGIYDAAQGIGQVAAGQSEGRAAGRYAEGQLNMQADRVRQLGEDRAMRQMLSADLLGTMKPPTDPRAQKFLSNTSLSPEMLAALKRKGQANINGGGMTPLPQAGKTDKFLNTLGAIGQYGGVIGKATGYF